MELRIYFDGEFSSLHPARLPEGYEKKVTLQMGVDQKPGQKTQGRPWRSWGRNILDVVLGIS